MTSFTRWNDFVYLWASSFLLQGPGFQAGFSGFCLFSELHSGVQVRPLVTQASLMSSVACILDAEPLGFRITLSVHRWPYSERRDASAASGEDHGRVLEGGNA